jgi:Glycosyl transferases group 1
MKCAFFQHWHAYKTGSTNHFIELLKSIGLTVEVFDRDKLVIEELKSFDFVVLYQADHLIALIAEIGLPALVVPMFDETLDRRAAYFRHKFEYISFSKTLHRFLNLNGNRTQYLQYWPSLEVEYNKFKSNQVFFWERTPVHVSVHDVVTWFKYSDYKIVIRKHWDPNHSGKSYDVLPEKCESVGDVWLKKEDFYDQFHKSRVFVAPRRWEGIGVTALEAMSYGNAVVGLDSPTLNEYVEHNVTGWLVKQSSKSNNLPEIDWEILGQNAFERARVGRLSYAEKSPVVVARAIEMAISNFRKNRISLIPKNLSVRKFVYLSDFER